MPECEFAHLSAVLEEGSSFPETGIADSCEPPHVGAGNRTLGFLSPEYSFQGYTSNDLNTSH